MNLKRIILALLMITVAGSGYVFCDFQKVIYGNDDRKDYFQSPSIIQKLADSVVSLWDKSNVEYDEYSGKYKVKTKKFKDVLNLCDDEPFKDQPVGAFCSGALIGKDIVITAGHCINSEEKCASTYFIFGYAIKNPKTPNTPKTEFDSSDVYKCSKIIKTHIGAEPTEDNPQGIGLGPDYAIIKLDREVKDKTPLKINTKQNLKKGMQMYVIGYPVGLAVKYADGAWVRDPSPDGYFVANLDTYGGNSGSPVFNAETNLIEGILVRGDNDFVSTPSGCRISNRVDNDGGRGEDVTKISVLYNYLGGIVEGFTKKDADISIKVIPDFDINYSKRVSFSFE